MDSATQNQERKPITTVTVGSVTVPIYFAPITIKAVPKAEAVGLPDKPAGEDDKTYESYLVSHYDGAQRIQKRRSTLGKARKLAKEIADRLNREGATAAFLSEKDRRILVLAKIASKSINMEVDEACRKLAELQMRLKSGTVEQAVDFFNIHGQNMKHGVITATVYAEYLAHLTKRGVGEYHFRDTKRYVGNFVAKYPGPLSLLETSSIDAFLAALGGSARNKNNHRKAIIAFFNFAVEKGFLPRGLPHAASFTTEHGDQRVKITSEQQAIDLIQPTDIYSPAEMRLILDAAADDPALRATLEIKAFSGVRTEEIVRLWWVMIAEADECIRVPDAVGKIDARRVPILTNLKTRLAGYPPDKKRDRVSADWAKANALYHAWQRVCRKAGVPYRRNAFRNSYFTYRLAIVNSMEQVAEEGGTSTKMLKKNYLSRAPVSKVAAEEWFSL
jgi:integrase